LNLFTALFRLRYFKDLLASHLKAITTVIKGGATTLQANMWIHSLDYSGDEASNISITITKFDEDLFLSEVRSGRAVLELSELKVWMKELDE
jgi:hypothetical protein